MVPPKTVEALGRNPRLRRSSAITYYSVAAALAALENAGIPMSPDIAERTAVVFAVMQRPGGLHAEILRNGCVTRRKRRQPAPLPRDCL